MQNGVQGIRYVTKKNFLGSHKDPNSEFYNPDNACYCLEDESPSFKCFKGTYASDVCIGHGRGGGYPKIRQKDGRLHDSVCDNEEEEIRAFCGRHIWKPPEFSSFEQRRFGWQNANLP